jgi:hypothetical protein
MSNAREARCFDLIAFDKHDMMDFGDTVLEFAAGDGAFVYQVFPDMPVVVAQRLEEPPGSTHP